MAAITQNQDELEHIEDRRLQIPVIQDSELLLQASFLEDEVRLPGADTAVQLSVTTIMITSPVNTPASLTAAPRAVSDHLNWLLHEDT